MKLALVGGAFALAAVIVPLVWQVVSKRQDEARPVRITDVLAYDGANHLVLDVKVLNPRSTTVFLKRFGVIVDSSESEAAFCCITESTHDYSIDLSDSHETPISHGVPGNEVERFRVVIVAWRDPGGATHYRVRPFIIYNEVDSAIGPAFGFYLSGITKGERKDLERVPKDKDPSFSRGWRDVRKEFDPDFIKVFFGPGAKATQVLPPSK